MVILELYDTEDSSGSLVNFELIDSPLHEVQKFVEELNNKLVQEEIELYQNATPRTDLERRIFEHYIEIIKRDGINARFNKEHRMRLRYTVYSIDILAITKKSGDIGFLNYE